jgi:UDP-N-acetylglucosamine transferase subunit ALG13
MIFVTTGTALPFDRMIKIVDAWAQERGRNDVFAQIGIGGWKPQYLQFADLLHPSEFAERVRTATVVISHAGIGTILSALHYEKPILVIPKLASLGEHRNEHQTATARRMMEMGNVNVAFDDDQLRQRLDRLDELQSIGRIGPFASESLLGGLRSFIHDV